MWELFWYVDMIACSAILVMICSTLLLNSQVGMCYGFGIVCIGVHLQKIRCKRQMNGTQFLGVKSVFLDVFRGVLGRGSGVKITF